MTDHIAQVYVSCDEGQQIVQYALDRSSGALARLGTSRLPVTQEAPPTSHLPMAHLRTSGAPLTASPDKATLYASLRRPPWRVVSCRIDGSLGSPGLLSEAPIPDSTPFITTDRSGRFLIGACHIGNCVWISPIAADGRVSGPPVEFAEGIVRPHSVLLHSNNRFAYVAATGHEEILTFRFDPATGKLVRTGIPGDKAIAGASPRHMALHPDEELLFCMNEDSGIIDSFRIDPDDGSLTLADGADGRAPENRDAPGLGADLHLSPDGRFLYGSARADSTISAYAVAAETGALTHVETVAVGSIPRSFAIDPTGRFLIAAGQGSGDVTVFALDGASGRLTALSTHKTAGGPIWVEIVEPGGQSE